METISDMQIDNDGHILPTNLRFNQIPEGRWEFIYIFHIVGLTTGRLYEQKKSDNFNCKKMTCHTTLKSMLQLHLNEMLELVDRGQIVNEIIRTTDAVQQF